MCLEKPVQDGPKGWVPVGDLEKRSSWLLALAWPSPRYRSHLESEPENGRSLSLSFSLYILNKQATDPLLLCQTTLQKHMVALYLFRFGFISPGDLFKPHLENIYKCGHGILNSSVPAALFQQLPTHIIHHSTGSFWSVADTSSVTTQYGPLNQHFKNQSWYHCWTRISNSLNIIKYLISSQVSSNDLTDF